jgi:hypothetical protein
MKIETSSHPTVTVPTVTVPTVTVTASPATRRATGASLVALVLIGVCVTGVLFLHLVRRDVDPLRNVMSLYANGRDGLVMTVAFHAFGLAALALALRLRGAVAAAGAGAVRVLLALAGGALILAGVFEVGRPLVPQTIEETVHSNAAIAAFMLLIGAMLLFSRICRRDPRWWSFRWTSTALAVVTTTAGMATLVARPMDSSGGVQRALAVSALLWLLLVARHVRTRAFRSS